MNLKRSESIRKRLIECSDNGELCYSDELEIAQYLFTKLQLIPMADAAKKQGLSYNGMKNRINTGKEMILKEFSKKSHSSRSVGEMNCITKM